MKRKTKNVTIRNRIKKVARVHIGFIHPYMVHAFSMFLNHRPDIASELVKHEIRDNGGAEQNEEDPPLSARVERRCIATKLLPF